MAVDLSDYVPVAERIAKLRADHPDAVLQTIGYALEVVDGKTFLVVCAGCFYGPDDRLPGIAFAWEPVPGRTPYTRDSEIMNAETSAWGRAIVAKLAAETSRSVASREEVEARRDDESEPVERPASDAQLRKLEWLVETRTPPESVPYPIPHDPRPTMRQASEWIDVLDALASDTPPPERTPSLRPSPSPTAEDAPGEPTIDGDARPWERRTFPFDGAPDVVERYWRTVIAAAPGIGPARLLAAARDIAVEQALPVPAALDEMSEPELVAAVRLWLSARADERGTS